MMRTGVVGAAGLAGVLAAAVCVAGCSSLPFGGGNKSPFSSASNFDVTFISAAQTWDLDKNGTVTCEEWKQYAGSALKQADGDGDGSLTAEEFTVMAKTDRLFEMADLKYYDANSDGRVGSDELVGKPNHGFKLLDRNQDCQIARDESVQVQSTIRPKEKDKGAAGEGPPVR